MAHALGSPFFWSAAVAAAALACVATLVGRTWTALLPWRTRPAARFYLAPVLGLGTLTLVATLLGFILPMGDSVWVPVIVWGLVLACLLRDRPPAALRHGAAIAVFALACGASMLAPLFALGAINAHNDTFTYLAHGDWLQNHSLGERITPQTLTPLTTQVYLYQQAGLRMGASFLLALTQALFDTRWAYAVYPAVVVTALAAACLAIGFPLTTVLRRLRRTQRLALLALPAFTVGGLVFGANLGFLPQTLGIPLAAGVVFIIGPIFRALALSRAALPLVARAALPVAMLFAAATYAYSEFAPFMLVGVLGGTSLLALRYRSVRLAAAFSALVLVIAAVLLNGELVRAYAALRMQAGAVVGTPVAWGLAGFVAHAFGLHGGAWDVFQWNAPWGTRASAAGAALLGIVVLAMLFAGRRAVWCLAFDGALAPAAVVLALFAAGVLYFRYAVPTPWPQGTGQSWSQFKLSDWSHVFVMAFTIAAIAAMAARVSGSARDAIGIVFAAGLVVASWTGIERTRPLMNAYPGVADLGRFYLDFRAAVASVCGHSTPVYLALNGEHHKVRQMALLFLPERDVHSDWTDDGYIFSQLPASRQADPVTGGDCIVEPAGKGGLLASGTRVGPLQIGIFKGEPPIRTTNVIGGYGRETDGTSWWYWVERRIAFHVGGPSAPNEGLGRVRLRFQYGTRTPSKLTVHVVGRAGQDLRYDIKVEAPDRLGTFEQVLDMPPSEIREVAIETDAVATRLGGHDPRVAAWMLRNLTLSVAP